MAESELRVEGTPVQPQPAGSAVDDAAFKQTFRRHAAGVSIVTATRPDGTPAGFTATSLASLAAVPPLATFNMARSASTWDAITESEWVAIHTLGVRNRDIATRLAADHDARFSGDHWRWGPHGLPIILDVTAWVVGRIVERVPVYNNAVIVVQIEQGEVGDEDEPLLYHEREYWRPSAIS